jgi:urease alpha subunit
MKLFAVVFTLLSSVAAFAGSASNQGASQIWITDVTIISPENLDHIAEGNVLIEDGRIVSVERRKGTKKPAGATVVSGKGQFLIPGLIDSHVHCRKPRARQRWKTPEIKDRVLAWTSGLRGAGRPARSGSLARIASWLVYNQKLTLERLLCNSRTLIGTRRKYL